MHLTALPTRCSIRVWKITRKRLWNLTTVLRQKKLAVNTFTTLGGQMGFVVLAVIITKLGQRIMSFINAKNAAIGFR